MEDNYKSENEKARNFNIREKIIIIDVHFNLDDRSVKTPIFLIFQYFHLIS